MRAIGSNPGHLLFCGVLSPERAEAVAETLFGDGLYSGWGIRTLSQDEKIYNPMSYHRGSVWPHDNSLIGFGLASNGLTQQALALVSALYEALSTIRVTVCLNCFAVSRVVNGLPRCNIRFPVRPRPGLPVRPFSC